MQFSERQAKIISEQKLKIEEIKMPKEFETGPTFKSGLKKPTSGPMFNKDFTPN